MIVNRELKTNTFAQRLLALRHRRKRVRRVIVTGLMLTSMVDMFSLLVIFLLQSFSTSPDVMAMTKGIVLPTAVSAAAPSNAPVLTLAKDSVLLDQKVVGSANEILQKPQRLGDELNDLKEIWQKSHVKQVFKGEIHLQADRTLSSTLVSRFINILNANGYSMVHLAVISGGSP